MEQFLVTKEDIGVQVVAIGKYSEYWEGTLVELSKDSTCGRIEKVTMEYKFPGFWKVPVKDSQWFFVERIQKVVVSPIQGRSLLMKEEAAVADKKQIVIHSEVKVFAITLGGELSKITHPYRDFEWVKTSLLKEVA